MKIRTKLLWALGSISLIPPIAAYVSLINNPRISFALRMNEYEARQGILAEQLQSDLRAVGSAVEESLNETYRISVEPKQRGDAERQRRQANPQSILGSLLSKGTWIPSPSPQSDKRKRLSPRRNNPMVLTSAKRNS